LQEVVSRHEAKDNAEPVEDGEDAEEDEEDEEGDDGEYQQAQDLYAWGVLKLLNQKLCLCRKKRSWRSFLGSF